MDKYKILAIIVLSFLLLCLVVYIYNKHISILINPAYKTNDELINKQKAEEAILYFFHATWCPYSKKALPLIQNFENNFKEVNNTRIFYKIVDGEKEEDILNSFELKHKVKIDSFPTIYLEINNDILDYNVKPTKETLMEFLETATK